MSRPVHTAVAGERGQEIAKATPFHEKHSWSWVTRTCLFDRIISEQIRQGADMVVNLAAGLEKPEYSSDDQNTSPGQQRHPSRYVHLAIHKRLLLSTRGLDADLSFVVARLPQQNAAMVHYLESA